MEREGVRMLMDPLLDDPERESDRALFPGGLGMLCDLAFRVERDVIGRRDGTGFRDEREKEQDQ